MSGEFVPFGFCKIGDDIWSGDRDRLGERMLFCGFSTPSSCWVFKMGISCSHFCILLCLLSFAVAVQLWQAARDGNSGSLPQSGFKSCGSQPGQPVQVRRLLFSRFKLIALPLRLPNGFGFSEWCDASSSSGISIKLGVNFFVAIFCFAIVMTSRILVRNSMAAGGGVWK